MVTPKHQEHDRQRSPERILANPQRTRPSETNTIVTSDLARDKIPDAALWLMWTNHLRPLIRSVLIVSELFSNKTTLEELALLADKMMEQNREVATVSAFSTESTSINAQFVKNEIGRMSIEIADLKAKSTSRLQPRHRTAQPRSHTSENSPSMMYYYHRRFGAQARKCISPYSFKNVQQ
ncbi:hypothetical protein EVAR_97018_1 [Eumeta japonica]|uniref:Uncharacterized protein n=1 Tax=Eumeta variegata TaxID=151549 RepID=A0A4C1WKG8_EUMVA|nr:hypothetical protein EVAR_97018_1 [Eumeta japonica]